MGVLKGKPAGGDLGGSESQDITRTGVTGGKNALDIAILTVLAKVSEAGREVSLVKDDLLRALLCDVITEMKIMNIHLTAITNLDIKDADIGS